MPFGKARAKHKTKHTNRRINHLVAPQPFLTDTDVVNELETNREAYCGKEWFTLYAFPSYLLTSVDRVRRQVTVGSRPGVSPTISCCIHHGLKALHGHEEMQALLDLKESIDTTKGVSAYAVDIAASWFRGFPIGVDVSLTGTKRQNITIPSTLKTEINDLSGDLGLPATGLATIAITAILSMQPQVLLEHSELMRSTIDRFLKLAHIRRRGGEGMLGGLGELVEGSFGEKGD